jgi:hypothetical protein
MTFAAEGSGAGFGDGFADLRAEVGGTDRAGVENVGVGGGEGAAVAEGGLDLFGVKYGPRHMAVISHPESVVPQLLQLRNNHPLPCASGVLVLRGIPRKPVPSLTGFLRRIDDVAGTPITAVVKRCDDRSTVRLRHVQGVPDSEVGVDHGCGSRIRLAVAVTKTPLYV